MSLWKIAWRSIQQRGLASLLTSLSMALGVMLVVCVLSIHGVVAQSFRSNANLGYNMIVGAKGGRLQLTLNSVFYLSQPVENIPYDYYLEFLGASQRAAEYRHSIQYDVHQLLWESRLLAWLATSRITSDETGSIAGVYVLGCSQQACLPKADYSWLFARKSRPVAAPDFGRAGRFSQFTKLAIPLCLGDYLGRFRVVGTTPDFFEKLMYGEDGDRGYRFAEGRNFLLCSEEHRYFEAVVGATVASELGLHVGSTFNTTHGDEELGGHAHNELFHVVGVLEPSGTPNDRAAFISIEGFFLMGGHSKPVEESGEVVSTGVEQLDEHAHDHEQHRPLAVEQREVTAILLTTVSHLVAPGLQTAINEGQTAQAVLPVLEIYSLFDTFVKPIEQVLLGLTGMICVVSGISILVSIYNSMSERRHEIAVMRALGASRNTVMTVILLEAVILSLLGGAAGWILGHSVNVAAGARIEQQTGVQLTFWSLAPPARVAELLGADPSTGWLQNVQVSSELLLVPGLILLAIIVGFFPALAAYRTDVAQGLER